MRQRALGSSDVSLSELTLGMWQLAGEGHPPTRVEDRTALLQRARSLGITGFECADSYAHGELLEQLGEVLGADTASRFICLVGTDGESMPPRKRFDKAYLQRALERAMQRLRRGRLDVLLLHNPSLRAFDQESSFEWLRNLPQAGAVLAWGVSAGSPEVARRAVECGAQVVQVAYNVLHTDELDAITPAVVEKRIGILARSVLAHGLLCGLWPRDKEFPPGDHRNERWTADELRRRIQQLEALRPAVGGDVPSLRAVALRYVLASKLVGSVVIGPRTPLQLDQLVREANVAPPYLSDDKLRALEGRLKDLGARP